MNSDIPPVEGEEPDNPGYMKPVQPSKMSVTLGNENIKRVMAYKNKRRLTYKQLDELMTKWLLERFDIEGL